MEKIKDGMEENAFSVFLLNLFLFGVSILGG